MLGDSQIDDGHVTDDHPMSEQSMTAPLAHVRMLCPLQVHRQGVSARRHQQRQVLGRENEHFTCSRPRTYRCLRWRRRPAGCAERRHFVHGRAAVQQNQPVRRRPRSGAGRRQPTEELRRSGGMDTLVQISN